MPVTARQTLINNISNQIIANLKTGVYRVAIDGIDGAGKSFMGDEITHSLKSKQIQVIRSSSDFFHNPRDVRYRLGRHSPEGYFQDSFNYTKLKELLLNPISEQGNKIYCERYFNHRSNQVEKAISQKLQGNAVLIFDGIFLHRKALRNYWDFSIFLKVTRKESLRRCYVRDASGSPDIKAPENRRYVIGQQIYLTESKPTQLANIVINNEDFNQPFIERHANIN